MLWEGGKRKRKVIEWIIGGGEMVVTGRGGN